MPPIPRSLTLAACAATLACSDAGGNGGVLPTTGAAPLPTVQPPNGAVAVTVGTPVARDATKGSTVLSDPAGGGVVYTAWVLVVPGRFWSGMGACS
ncbi:MAG TPA: hypothetical protein VF665_06240 [Longimicrobium sp.]|jgi:hypothetical protein|uniref:hypothetical protein n=1 Tax=Longimicrobium sp. TaxID=2029185 RepID=UPI002EDABE0C